MTLPDEQNLQLRNNRCSLLVDRRGVTDFRGPTESVCCITFAECRPIITPEFGGRLVLKPAVNAANVMKLVLLSSVTLFLSDLPLGPFVVLADMSLAVLDLRLTRHMRWT